MKRALRYTFIALSLLAAGSPMASLGAEAGAIEVAATAPQVKVLPTGIEIEIPGEESMHVSVYALTGQQVKHLDAAPGTNTIDLPSGYYIVRIGHTTVKVAVK